MFIVVQTTCATREEAGRIAHAAVSSGLCACAHLDGIESVYCWEGKLCTGHEWRVALKTLSARFDDVADMIRRLHSYTVPAITATALVEITPDYAAWVAANSTGRP